MKSIDEKLQIMKNKFANGKKARVMIIGLGSVGNYLLDYLVSTQDENLEICACGIKDFWNIDVTFAVSHFHDVVISKEGHSEGVDMLIDIRYQNKKCDVKIDEILSLCKIAMPTDAKRNQMNASSNFEIIKAILVAVRCGKKTKLHCPGVFGEIGGYPVIVDGSLEKPCAYICQDYFSIEDMRAKNRESIYLDGIENVSDGILTYTDELLAKVKSAFDVDLPKNVSFEEIDKVANLIIKEIIEKYAG